MTRPRSRTVPGHRMWRAKSVRRRGNVVAIRARHRLLPWQRISVGSPDLRFGAEAIARHLDGGRAGLPLSDSRVLGWTHPAQPHRVPEGQLSGFEGDSAFG